MRLRMRGICTLVLFMLLLSAVPLGAQVVSNIRVEGNEHVSRDRVLLGFGVTIGEEVSGEAVREGIQRLHALGNFADVQVYAEDQDDGRIELIVVLEERPKIAEIEITGHDKVDDSDIEDLLRVSKNTPYDPGKIEDSRVAILALYEEKGFPSATVDIQAEQTSESTVRVNVRIVEGIRVTISAIHFEGNNALDETDLRKVLETKENRWWRTDAFLDREVLEDDLTKVVERLRDEGYIDAAVLGYETVYDETGENVEITIRVDEGELYRVSAVQWLGVEPFAIQALERLTKIRIGDVYRPDLAEETIREAYAWYGEEGYIHARIYSSEDVESSNELKVVFHVDQDEPARVGQIHIVGNTRTQEKIIRRELSVRPGDLYKTSEVIASQRKVANLGFFDGPFVEFSESGDPDEIDLVFQVEERQTGRAGVGMSHTGERGITGFIELSEGNLFGSGRFLDLKWEFGKIANEVVLGFTEPWFMDRRLSLGFDVFDTRDKRHYSSLPDEFFEDAYTDTNTANEILGCVDCARNYTVERKRRGGDVRLGWPLFGSRYTDIYTKYTLEQFKLYEFTELTYAETYIDTTVAPPDTSTVTQTDRHDRIDPGWDWRSGFTVTLVRRTTDRRMHPRIGSYSRLTADLFGGAFGGDVRYQRYVLDTRKHWPSLLRSTFTLRGRGGIVTGYGDAFTVPDDTRFELGGVGLNGVRGYDNRRILPYGSSLYGGRTMLLGSAELKFAVTNEREQIPVYVLGFVDAGNTWETAAEVDPSDLYWGAGFGVRLEVPVLGNLGIDLGYGFDEFLGGSWIVHYQFGIDY
jgi:outer membrane protein insertion porin family